MNTHVIGVVQLQKHTPSCVDFLVTLLRPAHAQCCVHMHVMACKVQTDEALEDETPSWESRGEEYKQAGSCAAIGDHVQYGTKAGRFLKMSRCRAI